jgi:hypothetical protein
MAEERKIKPLAVGLRAQAEKVSVAIIGGTAAEPLLLEHHVLEAPAGAKTPAVLASIRGQLLDIIKASGVKRMGVRLPESTARGGNKEGVRNRMRLDGVLLEIAGTLRLDVVHGALKTIAKALGTKDGKKSRDADEFRGVAFDELTDEMREAVLVGVAALPSDEVQ